MEISLFIPKNTVLHRLDPRVKIAGLCAAFLVSIFIKNGYAALTVLCALFMLIIYAGAFRNLKRIRWVVVIVSAFCVVFWFFPQSLAYGIKAALRLDIIIFSGVIFVSIMRVEDLSAGLVLLGLPYRIGFAISLAFRLIPMLFGIIQTTLEAQQSRGLDVKSGGLIARAKKYLPLFVPVISLLVRNAHQLAMPQSKPPTPPWTNTTSAGSAISSIMRE